MPPSASLSIARAAVPRFQSAVRQLQKNGVDALKPHLAVNDADPTSYDRRHWRKPAISKRKIAVLRKQAMVDGTYGTFDSETGIGWDSNWDTELSSSKQKGMGRIRLTAPKLTKRYRTRATRADKIEQRLIGMDDRIDELHASRQKLKVPDSFEKTYKKMMKGER